LSARAATLLAGTGAEEFLDHTPPRSIDAVHEPRRIVALRNPAIQYELDSTERWDLRSTAGIPLRDELCDRAEALARTITAQQGRRSMKQQIAQIGCTPWTLNGLSDRLIVSHYENNYGSAVRDLNAVRDRLAELDLAAAPAHDVRA